MFRNEDDHGNELISPKFDYEIEFGENKEAEFLTDTSLYMLHFIELNHEHRVLVFTNRIYVWIERVDDPEPRNIVHSNVKIEFDHEVGGTIFYKLIPPL
ncbi:hypothetical protein ACWOBX_08170 [Facklamia languida]